MKTHPSSIIKTNHHSLRNDLRYTPPSPDHNRFAGLAASQDLGPIPKKQKQFDDYNYTGSYLSFSSYIDNGSSSDEDTPPPSAPFTGLRKRSAAPWAPSTPLNLRVSSNQVPTPQAKREATSAKSFFDQQYPELQTSKHPKNEPNVSNSNIESEGNSIKEYNDAPGLFGAW